MGLRGEALVRALAECPRLLSPDFKPQAEYLLSLGVPPEKIGFVVNQFPAVRTLIRPCYCESVIRTTNKKDTMSWCWF